MKRRWNGSSSSHRAMEASANADADANPTTADPTGEQSRSNILTIGHPVNAGQSDQMKIGEFLERCYYCRKQIADDSEVFMYGNLRAFCSAECRDNQIRLDHLAKEQLANQEKASGGQGTYRVKSQSSSYIREQCCTYSQILAILVLTADARSVNF